MEGLGREGRKCNAYFYCLFHSPENLNLDVEKLSHNLILRALVPGRGLTTLGNLSVCALYRLFCPSVTVITPTIVILDLPPEVPENLLSFHLHAQQTERIGGRLKSPAEGVTRAADVG